MRVLEVDRVEAHRGVQVLFGVVAGQDIRTGDDVVVVTRAGERGEAIIMAIMPDHEGLKQFDAGSPGERVKVVVRLKAGSTLDLTAAAALERA